MDNNIIDNAETYYSKKEEVVSKFRKEFMEQYYKEYDPTFRKVLELLIRDADPYTIIENLIEGIKTMGDNFKEVITNSVNPQKYNYVVEHNKVLLEALQKAKKVMGKYLKNPDTWNVEDLNIYDEIEDIEEAIKKATL